MCGLFDATLEEVLHLITTAGYAHVHNDLSPFTDDSELMTAVDAARGGRFERPPRNYPASAWFHYDDRSCDRECSAVEYFYWGLTSLLGAQSDRCDYIYNEWEPCLPDQVQYLDPALYEILTRPEHKLPTVIPDGQYIVEQEGVQAGGLPCSDEGDFSESTFARVESFGVSLISTGLTAFLALAI